MTSRREFLGRSIVSAIGLSVPVSVLGGGRDIVKARAPETFLDLRRVPDGVSVQTATEYQPLAVTGERWEREGIVVTTNPVPGALRVTLASPSVAVKRVHLRWRGDMSGTRLML